MIFFQITMKFLMTQQQIINLRNVVLFELREMTNLSTKEIRNSLKRYKKIYLKLINEINK